MKKLHLTVIVLFALFSAQAQNIAEADVLGEWKLAKMDFNGILMNFETNEVTVAPGAEENSEVEDLKAMLQSGLSDEIKNTSIAFKPNFVFESREGDTVKTGKYKLASDGTRQVLLVDTPEVMTIDISLKEGLLEWILPTSRTFIMYFKKQ
ncbi:MAG: hypothetical protein V4581_14975 [Bacteroidota bacterium]